MRKFKSLNELFSVMNRTKIRLLQEENAQLKELLVAFEPLYAHAITCPEVDKDWQNQTWKALKKIIKMKKDASAKEGK